MLRNIVALTPASNNEVEPCLCMLIDVTEYSLCSVRDNYSYLLDARIPTFSHLVPHPCYNGVIASHSLTHSYSISYAGCWGLKMGIETGVTPVSYASTSSEAFTNSSTAAKALLTSTLAHLRVRVTRSPSMFTITGSSLGVAQLIASPAFNAPI